MRVRPREDIVRKLTHLTKSFKGEREDEAKEMSEGKMSENFPELKKHINL